MLKSGLRLDVTKTGDTPKSEKMAVSLGKGPAVKVRDSGMLADPRVVRWMSDTAERQAYPINWKFWMRVLQMHV